MIAAERNTFQSYLEKHNEANWAEVLGKLLPFIHPVDQLATRIWFSFWPLKLSRSLHQAEDPQRVARHLLLDGKYRLEEQLDSSVEFLYGARFWPDVKRAILTHVEKNTRPEGTSLERRIQQVASQVASEIRVAEAVVLGITAVGFMALQQVGIEVFSEAGGRPSTRPVDRRIPEEVLRTRCAESRPGLLGILHRVDRKFVVTFDENRKDSTFKVVRGQDLSMASAADTRDFKNQDPRRIAGPIPAQCRSAACGYCWVGVLWGKEKLSPVTPFEKQRLRHFGYASVESEGESHPHIRLSCQSRCFGDVVLVVPPWNGVLDGRE